jgi:hypothetical protein
LKRKNERSFYFCVMVPLFAARTHRVFPELWLFDASVPAVLDRSLGAKVAERPVDCGERILSLLLLR